MDMGFEFVLLFVGIALVAGGFGWYVIKHSK